MLGSVQVGAVQLWRYETQLNVATHVSEAPANRPHPHGRCHPPPHAR